MTTDTTPLQTVDCPTCGAMVVWTTKQRWRPFCSERCKLIDLGTWLDESNRIAGNATADSEEST